MSARMERGEMARLFELANREAEVERIVPHKLKRSGKRLRGPCPLCGGSKDSTRFWLDTRTRRFGCFGCPEKGDMVELYAKLNRLTPIEAARELAGVRPAGEPPRPATPSPPRPTQSPAAIDDDDRWKLRLGAGLWAEARPASGSLVEVYLRARGISGEPLAAALRQLRFHPAAYHSGPFERPTRAPAMVGLVRSPIGATGGVHVTYLAADGRGKAALQPAKKMWGPQGHAGADGVPPSPGGVWLTHPAAAGKLVVAEGIESALSAAQLVGGECRIVAALSLGHLQGGWLADKYGRLDPDVPRADPERPAFTWPEPEASPWGVVVIAVDRDMKPLRVRVRKAAGGTYERTLDGETRASISAALAEANWRRAGASAVRIIAPAPGRDFNDELRARIAQGRAAA